MRKSKEVKEGRRELEGEVREERREKRREDLPNRQKCENWWGEGGEVEGGVREERREKRRLTKQAKM